MRKTETRQSQRKTGEILAERLREMCKGNASRWRRRMKRKRRKKERNRVRQRERKGRD